MNLAQLQADLRHFASERDWRTLHTPKNLSTALMIEAAELAEIFQWMTPEESLGDRVDQRTRARIGEEVADVLLYLLQVADHSQIDIASVVQEKLARNALKYPAKNAIARVSPPRVVHPGTHVLLDYENVQPSESDLRALVPDASQLWVFHGPHQLQVEKRFASFGADVTAVPISKPGRNSLDFHLSFYMGYIASRNQAAPIVVVANDKGYAPMLEHAKALGFAVRQQEHRKQGPGGPIKAPRAGMGPPASRPATKKSTAKKAGSNQATAKQVPAHEALINNVVVNPVKKTAPAKKMSSRIGDKHPPSVSAELIKKLADNLWKMGDKRPVKPASLRRALKSFLGAETGDKLIALALDKLITADVVTISATSDVTYPGFGKTQKQT